MSFAHHFRDLLESDTIQIFPRLLTVWFSSDSNEMLLEWYRPEGGIEVKQADVAVDAQEVGNVDVVG